MPSRLPMRDPGDDRGETADGRSVRVPRVPGQEPVERASARTVGTVVVAVAVFLYLVRAILLPFVVAGAIAYVCLPLVDRLARLSRLPRWAAAVLICLVLLGVFGGLGYLGLPTLIEETTTTIAHLQGTIERAAQAALGSGDVRLLGHDTNAKEVAVRAMDALRTMLQTSDAVTLIAGGGVSVAFGGLFTVVLLFYFMIGAPTIARGILWLVPPKQRPLARAIWVELDPVLFRYFASLAIVVVYATAAAYVGLAYMLRLDHAALLAVLTGVLEMVPIIGPAASAIIAGLFAIRAAVSPAGIIAYAIYAIVLRLSIDQVVSPLVLGRAGRVHPTVIIFCFLAGGALFSIVGIIMAIPVALTIKTVLAVLYEERPADDETLRSNAE